MMLQDKDRVKGLPTHVREEYVQWARCCPASCCASSETSAEGHRREKEAGLRLEGRDPQAGRAAVAEAAMLPLARAQGKTPQHRQPSAFADSVRRCLMNGNRSRVSATIGVKSVGSLEQVKDR